MMIMEDVPRRKASRLLCCNEKTLASILSYWVNQAVEALDLSDVAKLAIDETSRKRGHWTGLDGFLCDNHKQTICTASVTISTFPQAK